MPKPKTLAEDAERVAYFLEPALVSFVKIAAVQRKTCQSAIVTEALKAHMAGGKPVRTRKRIAAAV